MSEQIDHERRHFFGAVATRVRVRRFSRLGRRRPANVSAPSHTKMELSV